MIKKKIQNVLKEAVDKALLQRLKKAHQEARVMKGKFVVNVVSVR